MPKEIQDSLLTQEKENLIAILEELGKVLWLRRWKEHIAFPNNINPYSSERKEREKLLRYLLLRVLINQQARIEKVRELSVRLSEELKDVLFFEPYNISELELFDRFKRVAGEKGSLLYKVGALGGIKPVSLFAYRFKAYEGFIKWLNRSEKSFYDFILSELKEEKVSEIFEFFRKHPVLEIGWVGNDPKACRMLVNWIIFIFNEIWDIKMLKMEETLMIVDGHVAKVFCRSGLLEEVLFEKNRPYIIQASKMRPSIEKIVYNSGRIPFYVDNGAFYLFEDGFCTDQNPKCHYCPINKICKKYKKWTSYQIWRED